MVPIFCAASWASLTSIRVAFWIDPFRDVYEAFVLYTFFQLLTNFLGGERSLIIMMHGRAPVQHLWPLNHVLPKVDISDPHSFLQIKRGILQYVWIKPALAIATIACKATGTFKEGVIGVTSGYFWTALVYNISICWSLYDLALFWVCMSQDLQPFRPMPKFICIKGIIFASWWQGFFLSILVWLGAIPSIGGEYNADNLAAAIQDALICFEMPFFAIAHWYAFSWRDYADRTISDARMPIRFALRDAFGPRDLIEDCKETFSGTKYDYRNFDAEDNVIGHEDSASRRARMAEGMRYERNGRGKYWVPSPSDSRQPLIQKYAPSHARTLSPSGGQNRSTSRGSKGYGTNNNEPEEPELDEEEERLYTNARSLEFGDWNYPVINTHYATREDRFSGNPDIVSQTTDRRILQPSSKEAKQRRKSKVSRLQHEVHQHDRRGSQESSSHNEDGAGEGFASKGKERVKQTVNKLARNESNESQKSHSSQLVDLVVEDHEAEELDRVRARKEGGPGWNSVEQKHYVTMFPGEPATEEGRHAFNPDKVEQKVQGSTHSLTEPLSSGDGEDEFTLISEQKGRDELSHDQPWESKTIGESGDVKPNGSRKGKNSQRSTPLPSPLFEEERNAWGGDDR
jgi:hypothetical protein